MVEKLGASFSNGLKQEDSIIFYPFQIFTSQVCHVGIILSAKTFISSLSWAIKSWSKTNKLLSQDFDAFKTSGLQIEDLLSSPLWQLRNNGIKLISRFKLESYYAILLEKLVSRSEAPILRRNCATAIGSIPIKAPETLQNLLLSLKDSYWEVRAASLLSMPSISLPLESLSKKIIEPLSFMVSEEDCDIDLKPIDVSLNEKNFEVLTALAYCLGKIGEGNLAFQTLKTLSENTNWIVQEQAIVALTNFSYRNPNYYSETRTMLQKNFISTSKEFIPFSRLENTLDYIFKNYFNSRQNLDPNKIDKLYINLNKGWSNIFFDRSYH